MWGGYSELYNDFNAAMVGGDYATAKIKAEALLGSLQQDNRITTSMAFATDPVLLQKQLFSFEALLIYSNACDCDLNTPTGTVSFDNFIYHRKQRYKKFE